MDTNSFAYLKSKVQSATKEELLMLAIDSAVSFATQAKKKIQENDVEGSHTLLVKAQRLILELMSSLKKDVLPEDLYKNIVGLYNFIYFRFVWGNVKHDLKMIDEGLQVLKHMRETWAMAINKSEKEKKEPMVAPPTGTGPLDIEG